MCHQTVSLVARHLEAAGIATVVIGSARDIVEEVGVPRFVFDDAPLGNPAGRPWDRTAQRAVVKDALMLLERAWAPRTTVQHQSVWDEHDNDAWRQQFMRVDDDNREALAREGERRRETQASRKSDNG